MKLAQEKTELKAMLRTAKTNLIRDGFRFVEIDERTGFSTAYPWQRRGERGRIDYAHLCFVEVYQHSEFVFDASYDSGEYALDLLRKLPENTEAHFSFHGIEKGLKVTT